MDKLTPEQVARDIVREYERAYERIMGAMAAARASDAFWKTSRQAHLLRHIAGIIDKYKQRTSLYLKMALEKIAEYESKLAMEDVKEFRGELKKRESFHLEFNEKYTEQVFTDTFQHIAQNTDRMLNTVKTQLREDSRQIFQRASIEGIPRVKAYRMLRDKMAATMPKFKFVDKAGRKWDTSEYIDMLTKTVMANTHNEIYQNTLVNEGQDLVKVSSHGATDPCKNWEGKILSLTGATKGYPTVAEAKETGEIFHPRCGHRVFAYDPEMDEAFKGAA